MDVACVDLEHLRVVADRFVVLAKLGVAVCPIVKRFKVGALRVLQFECVVFDCAFEPFELPIDQSSVAVDHRVSSLKRNSAVKIVKSIFKPTKQTVQIGKS